MEGIGGKGWSAEGNAPEKVATRPLPLRCACGPLPLMMPRVAHFSGASPSADLQIQHSPSLGVPANGPQTTETGRSVVWGASRWTSNAENGQKRRLGCRHMDLKRRKRAKTSLGVPANGPQTPETGETVAWGAGRWNSNAGNGRKRQQRRGRMLKRGTKKEARYRASFILSGDFLLLLLETEVLDVDCLLFGNTLLH